MMKFLKKKLKKIGWIRELYHRLYEFFFRMLCVINPEWNAKLRYKTVFNKMPNLDDPQTWHEKINWLKLYRYNDDPLVVKCADKYLVRDYVKECGCGDILNELYGVYDSPEDINWDELPNRFVMKWNFGAGYNFICTDKSKENKEDVIALFKKWGKEKYWLSHAEMHYSLIDKKIICERLLDENELEVEL